MTDKILRNDDFKLLQNFIFYLCFIATGGAVTRLTCTPRLFHVTSSNSAATLIVPRYFCLLYPCLLMDASGIYIVIKKTLLRFKNTHAVLPQMALKKETNYTLSVLRFLSVLKNVTYANHFYFITDPVKNYCLLCF